jgi:hypothetical protein
LAITCSLFSYRLEISLDYCQYAVHDDILAHEGIHPLCFAICSRRNSRVHVEIFAYRLVDSIDCPKFIKQ